jgi:hypothetical protein
MINGRTKGALAGAALVVGVATGGLWTSGVGPTHTTEAASCTVFAGRAGTIPCNSGQNRPDNQQAQQVVGRTLTGCLLGLVGGGGAGVVPGCLGGLASNIPW